MIHATRGVGKTYLVLCIAEAVRRGGTVLGWHADNPSGVLYLDGEMTANSLQARLRELGMFSDSPAPAPLKIVTPDFQRGGMPDLATAEGQALVDHLIDDTIRLVIVDPISALVRTGEENTAEGWLPVQDWALGLRARGISVLFVHHSGKSGLQRGTSRREDVMDSVLNLRRPKGYSAEEGAVFEVHYEKSRGFYGDNARPFEARLIKDDTGAIAWERRDLNDRPLDLVVKMMNDGKLQKDIAAELGVSDARVSQLVKRSREAGLIGSTDKSQRQRTA